MGARHFKRATKGNSNPLGNSVVGVLVHGVEFKQYVVSHAMKGGANEMMTVLTTSLIELNRPPRQTETKQLSLDVSVVNDSCTRNSNNSKINVRMNISLCVCALGGCRFARWRNQSACYAMPEKKSEKKKSRAQNSTRGGPWEPPGHLGSTETNNISLGIHARDVPLRVLAELVRVLRNAREKIRKE